MKRSDAMARMAALAGALLCAVGCARAMTLDDIPGAANVYTAAETDARIVELAPVPGDYANVSNLAVNAGRLATNYTDWAVVRLAQTNAVLSGGPYVTPSGMEDYVTNALSGIAADRITDGTNTIDAAGNVSQLEINIHADWTEYPDIKYVWNSSNNRWEGENEGDVLVYENGIWTLESSSWASVFYCSESEDATFLNLTNETPTSVSFSRSIVSTNYIGRLALTNDIPPAVTVVAPSTNAVTGQAADAKAVGDALYTGFTEWTAVSTPVGHRLESCTWLAERSSWDVSFPPLTEGGTILASLVHGTKDDTEVTGTDFALSRHLVTPTKTSQLTNDGSNGVPFAVVTQIPAPVDIGTKVSTNALAGQTYDFSRNYDIIKATADLTRLLGGTVTNNPTGGN